MVGKQVIPSFSKILDAEEITYYQEDMLSVWRRGKTVLSTAPCCNPCSMSRTALAGLRFSEYLISLKTDGVRFLLFLTTRPRDPTAPVALMIDRAWNMYEIEVVAKDDYFVKKTVLDGELVWRQPNEDVLLFLIFDAVMIRGINCLNSPFEERLARAARCVHFSHEIATLDERDMEDRLLETESLAIVHFHPPIHVRVKRFVMREHIRQLWDERQNVDHRVDGIIFHRKDSIYTLGTANDGSVLKWKPEATVDLYGTTPPRTLEQPVVTLCGRAVRVRPSRVALRDDAVFEFGILLEVDGISLVAVRERSDKSAPNSLRVVEATVQDVIDDIKIDELAS